MKIEDLEQRTIQRQIKNGYQENQIKNAWITASSYGEFEAILFKSIKEKKQQQSTYSEIPFKFESNNKIEQKKENIYSTSLNENDDEDENLKTAILASKIAQENESYQGGFKLRQSGTPCGLYNMGSTCYFNSLIQTYFFNQDFYQAILDWSTPDDQSDLEFKIQNSFLFLESLRTIFLKMICSDYQCVNPEEIFSFINNTDGIKIDFYQQQDIAEFNHILLDKIETAMLFKKQTITGEENIVESPFQIFKQNFYGLFECQVITQDQRVKNHTEDFNFIQIDVSSKNLLNGLKQFLNQQVEYKNSQNQFVDAQKICKFLKLPQVFQFQISRVQFSSQQETTKDSRNFYFQLVLDVEELCSQSIFIEELVDNDIDNQSTLETMLENLQGAYNFFEMQGQTEKNYQLFQMQNAQNIDQTKQALTDSINFIHQQIEQTKQKKQSKKIKQKINTKYHLQSIIIHSGTATYGHYYAFIKDFYLNKWFKFNDFLVEEISEQQVLDISYGKQKTQYESSTYLIMYLNENKVLQERNSKIPVRSFLTSKDQDFLNDVYGRFAKAKYNQQIEKILQENKKQLQSEDQVYEKQLDLPFNQIIQQYLKNYDWIYQKEKYYKSIQQQKNLPLPFLSHFALFYNQINLEYKDNVKWYCLDLAIKQYNEQYGVFLGIKINFNTLKQFLQMIQVNMQIQDKYLIEYKPQDQQFQQCLKYYQQNLKGVFFANEVIKFYQKNLYFDCIKALQALINFSRQIEQESQILRLTLILRFQIPFRILNKALNPNSYNFNTIILILAFEKQEFYEYKKQEYSNISAQQLINQMLNNPTYLQNISLADKQIQEKKQDLIKQSELYIKESQQQISQLLLQHDPKFWNLEKLDDSFYLDFINNLQLIQI